MYNKYLFVVLWQNSRCYNMTTKALNNIWVYLQGLSHSHKDRKWLAERLIEPVIEDENTTAQKNLCK